MADFMFAAVEYAQALNAKFPGEHYEADPKGRKYIRITQGQGALLSVHCFVERATGDVLKNAGWNGPAKGARGSLADPKEFQMMVERADRFGTYLYR